MTTIKITYHVETVVNLTDEGKAYLLNIFHDQHSELPDLGCSPAFVNAAKKLAPDAPEDLILRTLIGEAIGSVVEYALPKAHPAALGATARVPRVTYQETPEKLDPPEGTVVVVIDKRNA